MAREVHDYLQRAKRFSGTTINAGIQTDVATLDENDLPLAELARIAWINELGLGRVPSRPAFRHSAEVAGDRWLARFRYAAKLYAAGDLEGSERALRQVGAQMVGGVQESILEGPWVANAQSTIDAKGSDKPLVDHGQTRQSIRAELRTSRGTETIA